MFKASTTRRFMAFDRYFDRYIDTRLVISSLIALIALLVTVKSMAAVLVNGAGATFPEPIYTKWFSEYQKVDKDIQINYQGIGSGGGIRQLTVGTVDFGASDAPMTEKELNQVGKAVMHIPTVLGAVVVSYNLSLEKPLMLNGATVGDIFSGKITKWNNPAIAKLNPGVSLPELPIVVATRSDSSGTTAVFTDYLSKVSPQWNSKAGKTVDWFKGSMGAKGNAGVAGLIKQTPGTVGYIELVYALENKLAFAHIANQKGQFVEANMQSVSAAAVGDLKAIEKNDFKYSITNSSAKSAYPISAFTYLLVFESMPKDKGEKLVKMIRWSLNEGQAFASQLNYAPIPKELRGKILARLAQIKFN